MAGDKPKSFPLVHKKANSASYTSLVGVITASSLLARGFHIIRRVSDVTQLLNAIDAGHPKAADQLLPLVYEELRKLAIVRMANEKAGQTLQATALVHEAWLKIAG